MAKIHKGVVYNPTKDGKLSQYYYFAGGKRVYITKDEADARLQEAQQPEQAESSEQASEPEQADTDTTE